MSEANHGEMKERFKELLDKSYENNGMPIFVITHNTADYGDKYVVRLHETRGGQIKVSEECAVALSLDGARKNIPDRLIRAARMPSDDEVIVESWF
ncbi:hypothetical protein R7D97_21690 [Vibrio sp. Vb5031]|uniref:hypothetical protein n=1 Tax=Vibrio TaxID=662 RepID=UPI00148E8F7A|nr:MULTISPECIES: hypothetical protein [Vibrio]HAV1574486.1 hypothetical protein [Vibrio parahaemolyticus]EGQ9764586.1 hypothetical protein [Vibrio alginolyticus]EGR1298314.1 hypothetical protein [Vibrio alginolyticus]EJL6793748.1 hypothetical protein [Vibrio alginolyticus]EJN3360443.1 hypothetical protein [Vibrio alginolyticus]